VSSGLKPATIKIRASAGGRMNNSSLLFSHFQDPKTFTQMLNVAKNMPNHKEVNGVDLFLPNIFKFLIPL
jgi:hypothetical protein